MADVELSDKEEIETELGFSLEFSNSPNPFNPSTTIGFGLPAAGNVRLTVYNVLGQEVETLVDGYLDAGYHAFEWRAERAASGVYFYRLQTTEMNMTRKMILLK